MSVQLHIERLVLDGIALDRFEARRLQFALERMLASHLADPGMLAGRRGAGRSRGEPPSSPIALRPVEGAAAQIAGRVVAQVAVTAARSRSR